MAKGVIETWDKLDDFKRREVKFDGLKRKVYLENDAAAAKYVHDPPSTRSACPEGV